MKEAGNWAPLVFEPNLDLDCKLSVDSPWPNASGHPWGPLNQSFFQSLPPWTKINLRRRSSELTRMGDVRSFRAHLRKLRNLCRWTACAFRIKNSGASSSYILIRLPVARSRSCWTEPPVPSSSNRKTRSKSSWMHWSKSSPSDGWHRAERKCLILWFGSLDCRHIAVTLRGLAGACSTLSRRLQPRFPRWW